MAYTNQISLPFTVTGGVSTGAGHPYYHPTDTLSGYTNALTRFRFTLSGNAEYVRAPGISNDSLVWDMGDGTTVKGTSALHIYETPGTYTVSLVAYSSGGDAYLSTVTKQLSVGNFIDDVLSHCIGPNKMINAQNDTSYELMIIDYIIFQVII